MLLWTNTVVVNISLSWSEKKHSKQFIPDFPVCLPIGLLKDGEDCVLPAIISVSEEQLYFLNEIKV